MATGSRLISIIGKKNSGKTNVVVRIATALAERGLDVATIKHATHPAVVDRDGTDTWRHFREAQARRVLIEGPEGRVFFERTERERDPVSLARQFMSGADVVIVEGFSHQPIPRIEVFRRAAHELPHYHPEHPAADHWIGMLTDDATFVAPFPVFLLNEEWIDSVLDLIETHAVAI